MSILTSIFLLPLLAAIGLAFVPRNFAIIRGIAVAAKQGVDNARASLFLTTQLAGSSFIYSPPHTPQGLGRGYFFHGGSV